MPSPQFKINVATLNIQGQLSLNIAKQQQIQDFIKFNNLDILHLQEIEVSSDTFEMCSYISSTYNIIQNNSPNNKYGTASLVRRDFVIENIKCDTEGRAIVFDIDNITFANLYLPSGNDKTMKQKRDNYFSETIPQLLINKKDSVILSADYNCIIDKRDAMRNADQKLSSSMKRFVNVFELKDSFRVLYPEANIFSRYYHTEDNGNGATRLDRVYHSGDVTIKDAKYLGVSFSDHHGLIVKMEIQNSLPKLLSPRCRMPFEAKPEVVRDEVFKERLKNMFGVWEESKRRLNIMVWWEEIVKPGVKKLLIERGKEISKEQRGKLNLLLVRQAYLVRKNYSGILDKIE